VLLIALPWLIVITIWYAVAYSGLINPSLVPAPHQVAARFYQLLTKARLPIDILMSTQRVVIGVALGIAVAVPAGFVLGWYRNVRMFIDPLMNFFRALPPIALIPLVIVYFGIGEVAKVVILFYASFFQLDTIYVGIICIGLIALAMDVVLRTASRRLVAWQDRI
jgi:NitT/TauT family transport system permease protein